MEQRKCSAQIIIFSPLEDTPRKAVVVPVAGKPHNHPSYASEKLNYIAADAWRAAVSVSGPLGKTVGQIMRGEFLLFI